MESRGTASTSSIMTGDEKVKVKVGEPGTGDNDLARTIKMKFFIFHNTTLHLPSVCLNLINSHDCS